MGISKLKRLIKRTLGKFTKPPVRSFSGVSHAVWTFSDLSGLKKTLFLGSDGRINDTGFISSETIAIDPSVSVSVILEHMERHEKKIKSDILHQIERANLNIVVVE